MDVRKLLGARTDQEADARLRRRLEAAEAASARAEAREAIEAEHVTSLQAQMNKWNKVGVIKANSHDLKDPVVVPLGSSFFHR